MLACGDCTPKIRGAEPRAGGSPAAKCCSLVFEAIEAEQLVEKNSNVLAV